MCEFGRFIKSFSYVLTLFVRRQSFAKYLERTPQIN